MKELFSRETPNCLISGKITPEKLKAFVDAKPKGTGPVTRDEIKQVLLEFFKKDLLEDAVIADIAVQLSAGKPVKERRVAKGHEGTEGHDGKLLLLVKKFDPRKLEKDNADGDLRELHLFDNIRAEQVLGRIYPPKAGTPGLTVLGETIAPKTGKQIAIAIDNKSIKLERKSGEEFESIVSTIEGLLMEVDGKLTVVPELTIPRSVDFHVGNLDFIGKVIIQGDISPGFIVRGKTGVEVRGGIRECVVESVSGDITVKGFAFGGKHGRISAGGQVILSSAQELFVEAIGSITVQKVAIDCIMRSHTQLIATSGSIVGGETAVVCGAEAQNWGNDAGKTTRVVLCSDVETTAEFQKLAGQIAAHQKALTLIEAHLGPYGKQPARIKLLSPQLRVRMEELVEKKNSLMISTATLEGKRAQLLKDASRSLVMRINALKQFWAGVKFEAGQIHHDLMESIKGPATMELDAAKNEFVKKELTPIECRLGEATSEPPKT